MSLTGTFGITNEIISMLRQYNRTTDLVNAGSGAKLKPSTMRVLNEELVNFSEENLDMLGQSCISALRDEFRTIIHDDLGLTLSAAEVAKRVVDEDEEDAEEEETEESEQDEDDLPSLENNVEYYMLLYTAEAGSADINISKLSSQVKPNFHQMIQERPVLCWLLDSRSPFYSDDFAEKIKDASSLMNIRGLLATDKSLREELSLALGQIFRGELN